MKYIKQILIIFLVCFISEIIHNFLHFLPTSIISLVLMFMAFLVGIIKPSDVRESAVFLIEIMPILFIPAGVGLLQNYNLLLGNIWAILIIIVVSSVVTMGTCGLVTQKISNRSLKKSQGKNARGNGK